MEEMHAYSVQNFHEKLAGQGNEAVSHDISGKSGGVDAERGGRETADLYLAGAPRRVAGGWLDALTAHFIVSWDGRGRCGSTSACRGRARSVGEVVALVEVGDQAGVGGLPAEELAGELA